ncbi:g573 [Coccomyxa elongata]
MLEEEHAREAARVAAEQAAEHAARLEPGLAAGCGVCGILRYKGEALMQLHERSGRHNRAVARAAQAAEVAEEAVVAAEIAVSSNGDVNAVDQVSSTDLNGDGEEPNETTEESPGAQTFGYSLDDVYRSLGYSRIDSLVRILRADLFIPRARLIVECDESGHKFYDHLHESSRDAAIRRSGFRTYRLRRATQHDMDGVT